jgi:hypothetical protein
VSPRSRRRRDEPSLDDAIATTGTVTTELSDSVPEEPDWLRDA